MALKIERTGTTTDTMANKLPLCHTCRERKEGLYTVDEYMKPRCADCSRAVGKPIN